jgi:DNA-binding GntR family transcriptional regulator
MPPRSPRIRPVHASIDTGITTSKIVTRVFDQILEAIHEGHLQPGEHISDTKLAETFGVSRTPIREALQRLREIGVVEASPNRFTRVAVVSPRETAEAMIVWRALFDTLLDEVMPRVDESVLAEMTGDHAEFLKAISHTDMQAAATANFVFFNRLTELSTNTSLRRTITSVVHIVRLGGLNLPQKLDTTTLAAAQDAFLDAVRARSVTRSHEAMDILRGIEIPQ